MQMVKKVLIVMGTRPEAIKMAPVLNALEQDPQFKCIVCVTGQHREMLDQVMDVFKIVPDYDLDVMAADQTLISSAAKIARGLESVISESEPDIVMVHGDTLTTVMGALAAFYAGIPLAHVEAGLRTGELASPFPEEGNRKMVAAIARWNFCPTESAQRNLLAEGVKPESIFVTGNTVIDSVKEISSQIANDADLKAELKSKFGFVDDSRKLVLITGHRRENFGDGFKNICRGLKEIAERFPKHVFLYPVHLNPRVRTPVINILGDIKNFLLIEPVDYMSCIFLMGISELIITDSGGIQEEAPFLGVPLLVTRNDTEREEAVEAGWVTLVGTDQHRLVQEFTRLNSRDHGHALKNAPRDIFGKGDAAQRILKALKG